MIASAFKLACLQTVVQDYLWRAEIGLIQFDRQIEHTIQENHRHNDQREGIRFEWKVGFYAGKDHPS